ncbi:MAG: class I SAM-dependent methyltransferase [Polaromonas sp.]|nr:class I SAM-dependent methyltransferase [Polaromonas sp.]MDP3751401.1 class I SAM-dependent methyltransferase [Polaromonas sp.]
MDPIAWSLRRLYCPVDKSALVLEVGSGGSPYFRSNVLCDAYEETQERFFAPLIHDRPTVLAFVEQLPFKDDSFDFVIASHVLEHSADPEKFLSEIQRVGKAGYIEVPDALMERLTHYWFHRLEISDKNGELIIRKKSNYIQDNEVVELFKNKAAPIFPKWASKYPFHFHVRFYWQRKNGGIKYTILNPECPADWAAPQLAADGSHSKLSLVGSLKQQTLKLVRQLFSQRERNRSIDLLSLFQCHLCRGTNFRQTGGRVTCLNCGKEYSVYMPSQPE